MESAQLASFAFECFFCPGYFANVCRRLSLGWINIPGSGLNFVVTATAEERERVGSRVQTYLDDISEVGGFSQAESEVLDQFRGRIRELQIALTL